MIIKWYFGPQTGKKISTGVSIHSTGGDHVGLAAHVDYT